MLDLFVDMHQCEKCCTVIVRFTLIILSSNSDNEAVRRIKVSTGGQNSYLLYQERPNFLGYQKYIPALTTRAACAMRTKHPEHWLERHMGSSTN